MSKNLIYVMVSDQKPSVMFIRWVQVSDYERRKVKLWIMAVGTVLS